LKLQDIKDLNLTGKKVFIRCDFNVPVDEYQNITDDRRIKSALNTIRYCLDNDCAIIIASHFGRPKDGFEDKFSLNPVAKRLHKLLDEDVKLAPNVICNETIAMANELKSGEIMLLENMRFEKGETKNDPQLSQTLADMADFYINDAFGVSHRAHASVEGIAQHFDTEHKAAGFLLAREIKFFYHIIEEPKRPFVSIVGGSKVSGYDVTAANELIGTWKQISMIDKTQEVKEQQKKSRQKAMRQTSSETRSSGDAVGGKKMYRRTDLINLQISDPGKYADLSDEITQAYQEGRVK